MGKLSRDSGLKATVAARLLLLASLAVFLPCRVHAAPGATLSTSSLSFGSEAVGVQSAAQKVTLTNSGNTTLTVNSFTITPTSGSDFGFGQLLCAGSLVNESCCPPTLAVGASCYVEIYFQPRATGNRTGTLSVADSASGSPQTVALTGTGTAPTASLSPTTLNFGSVYTGLASYAQTVTLSNTGNATLILDAISITGGNSSDFSQTNSCGSLAAGTSCPISVTLNPAAPGARAASLSITDNATGSPQTISLSGTGVAVPPVISPGGIVPLYSTASTIQPGEWISIYGSNLAYGTTAWSGNFPTSLGGTSVKIDGKAAYLSLASPGQINLQTPDDTMTGTVPVTVTTAGGTASSTVTLAPSGPSFLLLDSTHVTGIILRSDNSGAYDGGLYDLIGPTGNSLGYSTVAAKPGDSVVLFGVGFGPTTPAVVPGQAFAGAAGTNSPVSLTINGVSITPSFAGLSGAGLYQINVTIPSGMGAGDFPLLASVGGVQTQAGVLISLRNSISTTFSITTISNSAPVPLTPLNIGTKGLSAGTAVQVSFSNSSGYSVNEQAVRVGLDGTVVVGVPLYIAPDTEQISAGTVSVALTQGTQTTTATSMTIQTLPPLSTYSTSPGQISHSFLDLEAMLEARRLNQLQAAQALAGSSLNMTASQATLQSLLDASILARSEVDSVLTNNSTVIAWPTLPDSTALQFDKNQLTLMDQVIAIYLTQQFSGFSAATAVSGLLSDMETQSGVLSLIQYVQGLANGDDAKLAALDGLAANMGAANADKFTGLAGLASGFGHIQAVSDALGRDIAPTAQCLESSGCNSAAQFEADILGPQAELVSSFYSTVTNVPVLAGLELEASTTAVPSVGATAIAAFAELGFNGQIKRAGDTAVQIVSLPAFGAMVQNWGYVSGSIVTTLAASTTTPLNSVGLCCFGASGAGMNALADASGSFDIVVPIGVAGTNYGALSLNLMDPFSGAVLSKQNANLAGLKPASSGTSSVPLNSAPPRTDLALAPGTFITLPAIQWSPLPTYTLSVVEAGLGTGTVNSMPAGIACGAICQAAFPTPALVTLVAKPQPGSGSVFVGWNASCLEIFAGNGPCTLRMNQEQSPIATFAVGPPVLAGLNLSVISIVGGNATLGTAIVTPRPLSAASPGPGEDPADRNTVLREQAGAGNLAVTLQSDSPYVAVPASVTVPAGQTSASFPVTTLAVSSATTAVISASLNGTTLTAPLTLTPATTGGGAVTGIWTGTWTDSEPSAQFTCVLTFQLTWNLTQTGNAVTGTYSALMTSDVPQNPNTQASLCTGAVGTTTSGNFVGGTVSGTAVTLPTDANLGGLVFAGNLNAAATTITGTGSGASGAGDNGPFTVQK